MSLDILIQLAETTKPDEKLPSWVSEKNVTLQAYEYLNNLKADKLEYIKSHVQLKYFKKKSSYLITASEVAREVNVATTTLISSSVYSIEFKKYLDSVNSELTEAKDNKLKTYKRTRSAGLQQQRKEELKVKLQEVRAELVEVKQRNAREQVERLLSELPLPIKRKIGLDV